MFADHLTEAQKKAYIIADNRMAMDAGWDEELLRVEIEALQAEAFDLSLTGFDEKELSDFFLLRHLHERRGHDAARGRMLPQQAVAADGVLALDVPGERREAPACGRKNAEGPGRANHEQRYSRSGTGGVGCFPSRL